MSLPEQTKTGEVEFERRDRSPENQYRRAIFDMTVEATVSLGETQMSVSDLLDLQAESIVPLASRVDDPIELKVDGRVIALGDLIETGDGVLALRITEIAER